MKHVENHSWPNCKETQCEQAHESWRVVMQMLNIECDDSTYVIGKAVMVGRAIGDLKVALARANQESFEKHAIGEAYKAVIDCALDELDKMTGLRNAGLDGHIKFLAAKIQKAKLD